MGLALLMRQGGTSRVLRRSDYSRGPGSYPARQSSTCPEPWRSSLSTLLHGQPLAGSRQRSELRLVHEDAVLEGCIRFVSVYLDRRPVLLLPPCFGPSMISTPATEFRLEAAASQLTAAGQRQIAVRLVPSPGETGWDVYGMVINGFKNPFASGLRSSNSPSRDRSCSAV